MAFLDCMGTGNFGSTRTAFCIILCQMQNRNKSLFAHQLLFERREGRGVGGNYYANRLDQGYIGNYSTNTFGSTFMWKIAGNWIQRC